MEYEKLLSQRFLQVPGDKGRVLDLIRYFQEKGYTYEEANRIMELADSTMRRAVWQARI